MRAAQSSAEGGVSWKSELEALGLEIGGPCRVLVVDDEPDNLEVLQVLLEDDYEVHTALGGAEALALLEEVGGFGVVISDQRMPGMTGVELLKAVERRAPETVRMILTGYSDLLPIVSAINDGSAYRYLLKPWDSAEMRAAVADAVWLYGAQAALRKTVEELGRQKEALAAALDERRRSQEALLGAERLSTLGRFTSGIAHNIRNNVTVMMTVLHEIRQTPGSEQVLRAVENAMARMNALLAIVTDVHSLARGRLDVITKEPVEAQEFLASIVSRFRAEPAGLGRSVAVGTLGGVERLHVDPGRMSQALVGLLRLLARRSRPDTPLEIRARGGEGSRVILEVGAGAVSAAASAPVSGPGPAPLLLAESEASSELGLRIARAVVVAHGGELRVKPDVPAAELVLEAAEPSPTA